MKKIAVIGATGLLGKPVTHALIAAGFEVTIIARDVEKARAIFRDTHILYGDLEDKMSLFEALRGQEAIYLSLHIPQSSNAKDFIAETDGLLHLLEAAKANNIQRIAYLSSLVKDYQGQNGFQWWVFAAKQKAVQILKGAGIPYTIFYPSNFMENFDKGGFKSGKRMNLAGKSKIKQYWISGQDFGKQVAKSFQILTDENRDYIIQGPEAYSMEDALKLFIANYKKEKLRIARVPLDFLKLAGKLSPKVNYIYHILTALNYYPEKFGAQQTWDELGEPQETIEIYAQRVSS